MTPIAPAPEPLEDKAARLLNVAMVWALGFFMFCGCVWLVQERWPAILAVLRSEPGADISEVSPLLVMLISVVNLALSVRNSPKVKSRIVRWIAELAAWISGLTLWSFHAWLLFTHWRSLESAIRAGEKAGLYAALLVAFFLLLTFLALAAIFKLVTSSRHPRAL